VQYNRLSHALLFLGREGSGALPLAMAFAQYVVCDTVNGRKAEAAARADVGQVIRSGNCRVWEMLTLEAWAGAHA
jgi:hypothetical protein